MCKDVTISEIKEAQRICLERGIPFFAYRLPDSGNFCFGAQISGEVAGNCSPSVFLEDSGFLFSPFHVANNSPVRFLRNDIDLSKAGDLDILKVTPKKNVPDTVPVGEIGKGIYIKQTDPRGRVEVYLFDVPEDNDNFTCKLYYKAGREGYFCTEIRENSKSGIVKSKTVFL